MQSFRPVLIAGLLCLCILPAKAQTIRYELGRRTRAMEIAWDAQPDLEARKRATAKLKQAVTLFFSFKLNEAARELDLAKLSLQSAAIPSAATLWAESLFLNPETRLLDNAVGALNCTLSSLYPVSSEMPPGATLRVNVFRQGLPPATSQVATINFPITAIPLQIRVPLKSRAADEGDYRMQSLILLSGKVLASAEQIISQAVRPAERIASLKKMLGGLSASTTDIETANSLTGTLDALMQKRTLETDFPAACLLSESEAVVRSITASQSFYGNRKTGQFWLTLATANGARAVRLSAPDKVRTGKPLPLMIALHGAGGSENMFFETYGHGAIVKLCEQRNWLLVSPRGTGMKPERVFEIIDELTKLYAIDRQRIFVVGHSMGAAQAIAVSQIAPERFAGIAALGGGGMVRNSADRLKALPFFIGIGTEDFALRGARGLRESLQKAEVKTVIYHEYADIEHLAIVQVALQDVFAFFDKQAGRRNVTAPAR